MVITVTDLNTRKNKIKGYTTTAIFTDSETNKSITKRFYFDENIIQTTEKDSEGNFITYTTGPTEQQKQDKFNQSINNLEFKFNPLNNINIEGLPDIDKGIKQFVVFLRNNPTSTKQDLVAAIDSSFPDSNWKSEKIIDEIIKKIKVNTFEELIQFAIDKKFNEVDE